MIEIGAKMFGTTYYNIILVNKPFVISLDLKLADKTSASKRFIYSRRRGEEWGFLRECKRKSKRKCKLKFK